MYYIRKICFIGILFYYFYSVIYCHSHTEEEVKQHPTDVWFSSLLATALISAAPVLVIYFIPDLKNRDNLLKILLAFAAGGLLGDAFLHLIPHAINPHDHKSDHGHTHSHGHSHGEHMNVGLWVVIGILSFLCVEKLVRLVKGDDLHSHSHSHSRTDNSAPKTSPKKKNNSDSEIRRRKTGDVSKSSSHTESAVSKGLNQIKVSGYLNLVADFAHNFTDGLAIGASFLVNKNVGIVTTITILFHEVPHEIGDYAILIQSGCTRKRAILMQLLTAIGAMFGTVLSLLAGDFGASSNWILPFTAGGFIYIATVTVIPELLENDSNKQRSILQTFAEIFAICVGVGMMIVIAYFE